MTSDQIGACKIIEAAYQSGAWKAIVRDEDNIPYQLTLPSASDATTATLRNDIYTALLSTTKKTLPSIPSVTKDSTIVGTTPLNPGGGQP